MTDRVKKQYDILKDGSYKKNRVHTPVPLDGVEEQASPMMQSAQMFRAMLAFEKPWVHPGERIGFNRSGSEYPPYGTYGLKPGEKKYISGNVTLDFETFLNKGFNGIREVILEKLKTADAEQTEFYQCLLMTMDAALDYAQRMRQAALEGGCMELYDSLCRVPWKPAQSLLDACVFMKFIIFTTRCNYNEHITLGRFDRYMKPFYEKDLAAGKTREELMEVLELLKMEKPNPTNPIANKIPAAKIKILLLSDIFFVSFFLIIKISNADCYSVCSVIVTLVMTPLAFRSIVT